MRPRTATYRTPAVRDLTATNKTHPLIVGPATDSGPSVSPDGTKVAFARRVPESDSVATMVASVDGSNVKELPGMSDPPQSMVWSPNSDQLAVVGIVNGTQGLWTIGLDGRKNLVQLHASMNQSDGFGRTVSDWLHADADHRVPAHLDAILRRTRTERQRSAWSSLERWLPMETTLRIAPTPWSAWLLVAVALIVAIGAAVIAAGAWPRRPDPFGPARNGDRRVWRPMDGDIYALDTRHRTSRSALIVGTERPTCAPVRLAGWYRGSRSLARATAMDHLVLDGGQRRRLYRCYPVSDRHRRAHVAAGRRRVALPCVDAHRRRHPTL